MTTTLDPNGPEDKGVDFRVKIRGDHFARYKTEDMTAMGRIVSILQKDGGWEWVHYNEYTADTDEVLFEAKGAQPEVAAIFMAMQKGLDIEPLFEKIVQDLMMGDM